jgi:hypothetical protein
MLFGRMYPARRADRASEQSDGPDFFDPWVPRRRWELTFSEFDCGSQIGH